MGEGGDEGEAFPKERGETERLVGGRPWEWEAWLGWMCVLWRWRK